MRNPWPRSRDVLLAMALIVVAVYVGCDVYPQVRFDRERIEIWTAPHQIQVSGLYHYSNPSRLPAFFSMGLPFPVDANHPHPSVYAVSETTAAGRSMTPIPLRVRRGNITFRIFLMPRAEKWIRVDYFQTATSSDGSYILTTTRQWHRPLDRGDYILHLAPGNELAASNYALAAAAAHTYSFSKTDFYPNQDWQFAWRESTWQNTAAGSSAGGKP